MGCAYVAFRSHGGVSLRRELEADDTVVCGRPVTTVVVCDVAAVTSGGYAVSRGDGSPETVNQLGQVFTEVMV